MPPKAANSSKAKHKSTLKLDSPPPTKKLRSSKGIGVLSLSTLPVLKPGNQPSNVRPLKVIEPVGAKDSKGKGKAVVEPKAVIPDGRLWVDKYEPESLEQLAVHKRKVEDVRSWISDAFSGKASSKYRRLLVLTGPAGSAKTTTLRVLAREMDFEIIEYKSPTPLSQPSVFTDEPSTSDIPDMFSNFLGRAGAYTSVFAPARRKVVLVEDLPNVLHPAVRTRFHDALRAHVERASDSTPVVLVISDAGVRAEGESSSSRSKELVVDVRTVVPPGLPAHLFTEIRFNPIADTLLTSAIKNVMTRAGVRLSAGVLQPVVEGANGDIRSAIMTLEFTFARSATRKQLGKNNSGTIVSSTQRENALVLFHLMGKIMYNKRKGDPHAKSASSKDVARDRAFDQRLKDPPPLPSWLSAESRRPSRVDVEMLYASTPIDASLFGLYIHQNYTQYCTTVEQCDSLIDILSWTDSNGSENWYDANPHAFHVQALGALHSLPTPVPRQGQRVYKPGFFDALRGEQSARDALEYSSRQLSSVSISSSFCIS
ncbi:Rad17 cell cycle checkpoint protein-domain-containing protein [Gloeopeniophorella convolvens]|nr:Rad17 cell cycle checkpoint protein-domain-containing protein [Gloeopeniophorella convolvens]